MRVTSIRRVDATHYAVVTDVALSSGGVFACDWMTIADGRWFDRDAQRWVSGKVLRPDYDGSCIFPPSATFTVPLSASKVAELESL